MNPETGQVFFTTPGEHEFQGIKLPGPFPEHIMQRAVDFPFADEDIVIDTYPKSGTTWLQEIVYLIVTRDFNAKATLNERVPFLEIHRPGDVPKIDDLLNREPPRIIKTHIPYRLLEKNLETRKPKIIIGMRNLKDMLVSYFHFYQLNRGCGSFPGTWNEFFEMFRYDRLTFGNWFDHVLGWWNQRHLSNVYFVMFEDLKRDPATEVRKLVDFLGFHATEEEIEQITSATSFKKMKTNNLINKTEMEEFKDIPGGFMRKGKVGEWRCYFTTEQNEYVDNLLKEKLDGSNLHFVYEL